MAWCAASLRPAALAPRLLAVGSAASSMLFVYDVAHRAPTRLPRPDGGILALAWSPDGSVLVAASTYDTVAPMQAFHPRHLTRQAALSRCAPPPGRASCGSGIQTTGPPPCGRCRKGPARSGSRRAEGRGGVSWPADLTDGARTASCRTPGNRPWCSGPTASCCCCRPWAARGSTCCTSCKARTGASVRADMRSYAGPGGIVLTRCGDPARHCNRGAVQLAAVHDLASTPLATNPSVR